MAFRVAGHMRRFARSWGRDCNRTASCRRRAPGSPAEPGARVMNYADQRRSGWRQRCSRDARHSRRRRSAPRRWRRTRRRPGRTTMAAHPRRARHGSRRHHRARHRRGAGLVRGRDRLPDAAALRARSAIRPGTFMQDLLEVDPRAVIPEINVLRCGTGSNIELFEYTSPGPGHAARAELATSAATTSRSTSRTSTSPSRTWRPRASASCSGRSR